jgi:hypothetical protein
MTSAIFFAVMFFYFYASKKVVINDHDKISIKKCMLIIVEGVSPVTIGIALKNNK